MMYETDISEMPMHREEAYERIQHLKKEFDLMLYGNVVS